MDDALVAEPGPTTLPPLRPPSRATAPARVTTPAAALRTVPDGPLLTIDPVPLPDPVPAGTLPPPAPSPLAALPAPVWCVLPAVGWQQRATRPIVAPLPPVAPVPVANRPLDTAATVAERVVEVVTAPDDEVAHLFPDGWPDAWDDTVTVTTATIAASTVAAGVGAPDTGATGDDPEGTVGPPRTDADADADAAEPADAVDAIPAPGRDRLVHALHQFARWASFAVLGATVWVLLLTTVPRLFGWQPTVITGHSMEPAINRGDVVVVRPATAAAYVPGAVITFSDLNRPGHLITHRVVKVNDDGTLVTRGDNNHDNDPQATPVDRVKGRAVLRVPFVGRPVVWLMDRSWLPLAGTLLVLVGVVRTLLQAADERRRPRPWPFFSAPARRA